MLRWALKSTSDLESSLTSIERVIDYSNNPSEVRIYSLFILKNIIKLKVKLINYINTLIKADWIKENNSPPKEWPSNGAITFYKYSVKYRPELDYVLRELSFVIKPQEKVHHNHFLFL